MKNLQKFGELVVKYTELADFITVYIEEAHPEEGWSFNVSTHGIAIIFFFKLIERKLFEIASFRQAKSFDYSTFS